MGFPRQEYWSGLHVLLQGTFPFQGSNLGLLHCRWILYQLSHEGRPIAFFKIMYLFTYLVVPGLSLHHVGSSSLTRDQIRSLALKTQNLSHGTTREVPALLEIPLRFLSSFFFWERMPESSLPFFLWGHWGKDRLSGPPLARSWFLPP